MKLGWWWKNVFCAACALAPAVACAQEGVSQQPPGNVPAAATRIQRLSRAAENTGERRPEGILRLPTVRDQPRTSVPNTPVDREGQNESEQVRSASASREAQADSSEIKSVSSPPLPPLPTSMVEPNLATNLAQTTRANQDSNAEGWLSDYLERIHDSSSRSVAAQPLNYSDDGVPLPAGFSPWWDAPVKTESAVASSPMRVNVDTLIEQALRFSSYVSVVSLEPEIQQANLVIEAAEFDWRSFLDNTYRRGNDPVGNTLTTGNNATRFIDKTWGMDAGVRQRNQLGGQLEAAQRFGTQGNNSRFLQPNPQGTSRLQLQYTQPLMNGAGRVVNGSRIVLAGLDARISQDEAIARIQDHLVKVAEGYWELYRARAEYFQRVKLLQAAHSTMEVLQGRESVDSISRQVLRAKAAVTSRRSEIVRAQAAIRNAESQLRLLVNSPELIRIGGHELTPEDSPLGAELGVSMEQSLRTALLNRPDISQAIRSVRVSAVRLEVADNQVLPKLDLVATTYVAGLAGQKNFISAYGDQFSEGGLGYSVGIVIEQPWGNRAALARQQQRQLEMNRELSRFRLTVEQSLTSTEIAVRETETMYREMVSRYQSMLAVDNEVRYLFHRWTAIPGIDDSAAFLLENLLDAQYRLTEEESALVRAQVGYAMAIVRMKSEMGTLLRLVPDNTGVSPEAATSERVRDSNLPSHNAEPLPSVSPDAVESESVTSSAATMRLPSTSQSGDIPLERARMALRRLPAPTH